MKFIKQLLLIMLAILILSVGVNMFLGPHDIAAGGVSGIGILAEEAFGISRSILVFGINSVLLVFALVFLGKKIFLRTFIGSNLLPIGLALVPNMKLVQDRLLSVIFGSMIFAIGVVILYRNDASSGGTTIPPMIMKKYFNISPSIGLMMIDAVIVIFNIFIFDFDSFLYALLSVMITAAVMNYAEKGFNRKIAVTIISKESDNILENIMNNIERGVTKIPVVGGYSKKEKDMLFVVVDHSQYQQLKKLVQDIDRTSFMVVGGVTDVQGNGFSYHTME